MPFQKNSENRDTHDSAFVKVGYYYVNGVGGNFKNFYVNNNINRILEH